MHVCICVMYGKVLILSKDHRKYRFFLLACQTKNSYIIISRDTVAEKDTLRPTHGERSCSRLPVRR